MRPQHISDFSPLGLLLLFWKIVFAPLQNRFLIRWVACLLEGIRQTKIFCCLKDRRKDRQTDGQPDRQTKRQTGRWTAGQTDEQTDRQMDSRTDRWPKSQEEAFFTFFLEKQGQEQLRSPQILPDFTKIIFCWNLRFCEKNLKKISKSNMMKDHKVMDRNHWKYRTSNLIRC